MGEIFKGLCESVKGEMEGNKSSLEGMIEKEVRDRQAKDGELLHQMERDKVQIQDDLDQKYKLQEQQRKGGQFNGINKYRVIFSGKFSVRFVIGSLWS